MRVLIDQEFVRETAELHVVVAIVMRQHQTHTK